MALAGEVVEKLLARKESVAAAESCTAGLAAGAIAAIPGASNVLWGSYVSYTPDAKERMLGIHAEFIDEHGAVSEQVALAMAGSAAEKSRAAWAFSITGLAGPGGGSGELPVGTVWIGLAHNGNRGITAARHLFSGSRNEVREAAVAAALETLLDAIEALPASGPGN